MKLNTTNKVVNGTFQVQSGETQFSIVLSIGLALPQDSYSQEVISAAL